MTPLNYNFITDMSADTKALLPRFKAIPRFCNYITLPVASLSPTGSNYLTVVSAKKGKVDGLPAIRFRVLTCSGGITVTVPYHDELVYLRYRSLLGYLKNQHVQISFPNITINSSLRGFGLYFTATDFKMQSPDAPAEPTIYI